MKTNKLLLDQRVSYWDNFKGALIALVVIGHCLISCWDNRLIRYIVEAIYFFHMPAFVFVSGYFSKSENSRSARSLLRLISAYLLFTVVNLIMSLINGHNLSISEPYNSLWYLLALIGWRLMTPVFSKTKWSIWVFVALALFAGLWHDVNNQFAFSRLIAFYPFFLAGFFFSKERFEKLTQISALKRIPIGALCLATAAILAFFSAKTLQLKQGDFVFEAYSRTFMPHLLGRISIFAVASICIIGLLFLMPQKNIPLLTKPGRNSLAIFLFHRPITFAMESLVVGFSTEVLLLYAAGFTFVVCAVFGSDFVSTQLNKALSCLADILLHVGDRSKYRWQKIILLLIMFALLSLPLINDIIR